MKVGQSKKLTKRHLRGATAQKVIDKINCILKDEFSLFYEKVFPKGTIKRGNMSVYDYPNIGNRADLMSFINRGQRNWSSFVLSESELLEEDLKHTLLLCDDTLHIEISIEPRIFNHWYREFPNTVVYDIHINISIIDQNLFLDSLEIEPDETIPEYVDIIGNRIHVGDVVVVGCSNNARLFLDKVKKLTPFSIVLENGSFIKNDEYYKFKIAVVSNVPYDPNK